MEQRFRSSLVLAAFAVLAGLLYPDILFGLKSFVLRDYGIFGYPLAAHQRHAFWSGELPLWNPFNCAGLPFLAQWNTMTLYPGALLYLLFPMPWAHGVFMLAHQVAAGWGMYHLALRWTGSPFAATGAGAIFAFNGLTMSALMWPNNIAALAWMPWVILALVKMADQSATGGRLRWFSLASFAGAVQILTGAPELIGFTWILAFVAMLTGGSNLLRSIACCCGVLLLALCLSGPQLLPFFELLTVSQRSSEFGGAEWSMPSWGWANFFVPLFRFYRSPQGVYFQSDQEWTSSYYFGAVALTLAPLWFARRDRRWLWVILVAGSFWLALGPAGKLLTALKTALPALGFIRFPIKFVAPLIFGTAVLTAFALRDLEQQAEADRRKLLLSAGLVSLIVLGIAAFSLAKPYPYESPRAVLLNALVRVGFIAVFVLCVFRARSNSGWKVAVVALLAADLLTHAPRQNTTARNEVYGANVSRTGVLTNLHHGTGRAFQTRAAHDRFYGEMRPDPTGDYLGRRLGLYGNCNLLDQLPVVDGFYSLYLPWQRELWEKLFLAPTNAVPRGFARMLGVAAYSSPSSPVEWAQTSASPLPFLSAGQRVEQVAQGDLITRLTAPDFDPAEVAYVADPTVAATPKADTTISEVRVTAHQIRARVEAAGPTILLVSQAWYPAWRATLNGRETPVFRGNHAFQAITVPAGVHEVEFRYVDARFRQGLLLAFGALLICATLIAVSLRRRFSA
ncbi:MAG TPA: hypothetical protein VEH27_04940 [Methylomirabilota bacterium]|nr:hypothetical protein [Methylomirabilota bacterium]